MDERIPTHTQTSTAKRTLPDPDLRRSWLFSPGADPAFHTAMLASPADAVIVDLEDFTPAALRPAARQGLPALLASVRERGKLAAVRINALDADGPLDLAAAMAARADVIALPMANAAAQMVALDAAITHWERALAQGAGMAGTTGSGECLSLALGATEILPVCETALGVVEVRAMAAASRRVRCALLGAEDLANDLCAERQPDAVELDYARRRFVLECRAAGIEPIDAPYTFADAQGAADEARYARRLGYRSKALVRPDHAAPIQAVLTPSAEDLQRAQALVAAFEAGRARGEDRVLVDGLWVEVPTYRNALRTLARAQRLAGLSG